MAIKQSGIGLLYWRTDLIGGDRGSICPVSLANNTLVKYKASLVTGVFPNEGGILAVDLLSDRTYFFCTWLADSGHYILPFNCFEKTKHSQASLKRQCVAREGDD